MGVKINIYVCQIFKAVLNYNKEGLNVKKSLMLSCLKFRCGHLDLHRNEMCSLDH